MSWKRHEEQQLTLDVYANTNEIQQPGVRVKLTYTRLIVKQMIIFDADTNVFNTDINVGLCVWKGEEWGCEDGEQ